MASIYIPSEHTIDYEWLDSMHDAAVKDVIDQLDIASEERDDPDVLDDIDRWWYSSEIYLAFRDCIDEFSAAKRAKIEKRKTRKKKVYLTHDELDQWLINALTEIDAHLMADALLVGRRVAVLWAKDPAFVLDRVTGRLAYAERAYASLPKWSLRDPSTALAAVHSDIRLPQSFYYVVAFILVRKSSWRKAIVRSCEEDQSVPMSVFTDEAQQMGEVPKGLGGFYILASPDQAGGYLGKSVSLRQRLTGHRNKGVNRYVRDYAGSSASNSMKNWSHYAIWVENEEDGVFPSSISSVIEPALIALGGFSEHKQNFNINIFDNAGWRTLATTLDVIKGYMEVVKASHQIMPDGSAYRFPTEHQLDIWEREFKQAFGNKIAGRTIYNIVYGRARLSITKLLPQPKSDAYCRPESLPVNIRRLATKTAAKAASSSSTTTTTTTTTTTAGSTSRGESSSAGLGAASVGKEEGHQPVRVLKRSFEVSQDRSSITTSSGPSVPPNFFLAPGLLPSALKLANANTVAASRSGALRKKAAAARKEAPPSDKDNGGKGRYHVTASVSEFSAKSFQTSTQKETDTKVIYLLDLDVQH